LYLTPTYADLFNRLIKSREVPADLAQRRRDHVGGPRLWLFRDRSADCSGGVAMVLGNFGPTSEPPIGQNDPR